MLTLNLNVGNIIGFDAAEKPKLAKLAELFMAHQAKNFQKNKYYEGKIALSDV